MFSAVFASDQKWFPTLSTSHFRTVDSEGSLDSSSMALPSPRSEHIQIPAANGNP
jgi:hypothetical protein